MAVGGDGSNCTLTDIHPFMFQEYIWISSTSLFTRYLDNIPTLNIQLICVEKWNTKKKCRASRNGTSFEFLHMYCKHGDTTKGLWSSLDKIIFIFILNFIITTFHLVVASWLVTFSEEWIQNFYRKYYRDKCPQLTMEGWQKLFLHTFWTFSLLIP